MTKGEEDFLKSIEIQFEVAVESGMLDHADRVAANTARHECRDVMLRIFRKMKVKDVAEFSTKITAWGSAVAILRAKELLAITDKSEMTTFLQTVILEELGVKASENEREAYSIYATKVTTCASQVITNHLRTVLLG